MNIVKYFVNKSDILVFVNKSRSNRNIVKSTKFSIPMSDYETWTLIRGKREWEISVREAGDTKVTKGICSMEEYWHLGLSYIIDDLTEYLKNHKTTKNDTANTVN